MTRRATDCTGVAATWCPNHGTCTCPRDEVDGTPDYDVLSSCPLHSHGSPHAR